MAWPAGGISTAQLDNDTDSPLLARPALLATVQAVNDMAASRGTAGGVASLDGGGLLPVAQLPGGRIPAGAGMDYWGDTLPAVGWLWADGSAVSRTTYAELYAVYGTKYGAGDGSTTLNLPDKRGRVSAGKDDMGGTNAQRMTVLLNGTTTNGSAVINGLSSTALLCVGMRVYGTTMPAAGAVIQSINSATQVTLTSGTGVTAGTATALRFAVADGITLGASGGAQAHTLTTAQMPAHSHDYGGLGGNGGTLDYFAAGTMQITTQATTTAGSSQAHPNMQPTIVCNYIIKT